MRDRRTINMKMKLSILLLLISFMGTGCYYDVEEELYPVTNCDTVNVTYSGTVSSIITTYNCTSCHVGNNPSGGFRLDSYTGVKAKVTDNRLWGAINHLPGFAPMPQGQNKMNQCDINKIKAWIDAGAPNN